MDGRDGDGGAERARCVADARRAVTPVCSVSLRLGQI